MRVVAIHERLVGSRLAMPVHGDGGRLMLRKGTILSHRILEVLRRRGYTRVAIEDPLLKDIEPEDAINEETRQYSVAALEQATARLMEGKPTIMREVRKAVDLIISDLLSNSKAAVGVYSLCSYDQGTYAHSVNVCVFSLAIAETLGWSASQLRVLGMGALLHDIGKVLVPLSILNKPAELTDEEYALVKTHVEKGWDLLSACYDVGPMAASCALLHHERLDGSGYPRGVKGDQISVFGRITAVADVWEAMTSDRPHRKAIFPEAVVTQMNNMKGTKLGEEMVDALFKRVVLYPTGSILSLWGGFTAVVIKQDPRSNFRPFLRIIAGPGIISPIDLSLYEHPSIKVSVVLDDYPPEVRNAASAEIGGK
jgi:putative nucleotidyltransferase with HDIG domain